MEDNDTFRLSQSEINLQKKSPLVDTEIRGESALRRVKYNKTKHLAEREMYKVQKKRKKKKQL